MDTLSRGRNAIISGTVVVIVTVVCVTGRRTRREIVRVTRDGTSRLIVRIDTILLEPFTNSPIPTVTPSKTMRNGNFPVETLRSVKARRSKFVGNSVNSVS
jgi:transcriptional regulator of met regulon